MPVPASAPRVPFAAPACAPAEAFGGPIPVMSVLARGLVEAGWAVDVVTTSLTTVRGPRTRRTRVEELGGATVRYVATPLSYRWMGITPTLPLWLERLPRPDVVHVFGFRDPVGSAAAAWCRLRGVPYVLEALGMFRPKLRKIGLKRGLDATVYRHVPAGAGALVAASARERHEYLAGGIEAERIVVRPNGFPPLSSAPPRTGALHSRIGAPAAAPIVLSIGRVAAGKGLELLADAIVSLPQAQLVIAGPDDGHGVGESLLSRARWSGAERRVHLLGPLSREDVALLYREADVLVLASEHESFGMVVAEAASAGLPAIVSDRCGVAELMGDGAALVVPYEGGPVREALARVLGDVELRSGLAERARAVAARWSWEHVTELQQQIYRDVLATARRPRTAS